MYLIFKNKKRAEEALAKANANAGLPNETTKTLAEVEVIEDDRAVFMKPHDKYLAGVGGTEAEYDKTWFAVSEAKAEAEQSMFDLRQQAEIRLERKAEKAKEDARNAEIDAELELMKQNIPEVKAKIEAIEAVLKA